MNARPSRFNSGDVLPADPEVRAKLGGFARGAGAVTLAAGLLALVEWAADVAILKYLAFGETPIKSAVAIAFALSGLSLWAVQTYPANALARVLTLTCSAVVAGTGLLALGAHLAGGTPGIHLPPFLETPSAAETAAWGTMAPATSVDLVLIAIACVALAFPGRRGYRIAFFSALIVLAISATGLLSHMYGLGAARALPAYRGMALLSSFLQALLSAGIVAAVAARAESSLLVQGGPGGIVLRRLCLPGIAVLVALSWLRLSGERAGLYGFETGLAIMVMLAIVVLGALVWHTALHLNALEAERGKAMSELRASESRLDNIIGSVGEAIISLDREYHIVLFNPAAERIFGRSQDKMLGQPLGVLIPERFRERHEEHIRVFATTGETTRSMGRYGVIRGLRANGEEFPMEATISQAGTEHNRLFTVILRDISERQRGEQVLQDYTQQLRRLSRQLFQAEESVRRQMARELHDRIGANLTALTLNLNLLRREMSAQSLGKLASRFDDSETLVYATGQLVRDIMNDLRPPGLEQLGFVAALTEHARQFATRSGIPVTVRGTEPAPRLPPDTEITLFRIAQEALLNVAKHARASDATVVIDADPDKVTLTIFDNGRGFDVAAHLSRASASLGMVAMRERAESLGGRLRVESAPGQGARVTVEVPRAAATS